MAAAPDPGKVAWIMEDRTAFGPALAELRVRAGWTTLELDHRAGFHDGYCGKLESRSTNTDIKRWGFHVNGLHSNAAGLNWTTGEPDVIVTNAGQTWLDCLGVVLVLLDKKTAEEIGAVPAPRLPPGERRKAPKKTGPCLTRASPKMRSGVTPRNVAGGVAPPPARQAPPASRP